jgi:hypothetical protein
MKIRITGLPGEADKAVTIICDAKIFNIIQVDGPYPNRGDSRMVRLYLEVQLPTDSETVP